MLQNFKVQKHLVQTAKTWPISNDGWETRFYWSASTASISVAGNGSASITGHAGKIHDPLTGRKDFVSLEESPVGQWCRIIVADINGTITVNDEKYRAVWHGIIKQRKIKPSAGDLPTVGVSMSAAWITAAYEACDILHSWELDYQENLTESYTLPVFNLLEGGDMSSTDKTIDGTQTRVFQRNGVSQDSTRWTYAAALKYLCATARPWVPPGLDKNGPILVLGNGYPAALDVAPLPQKTGRGRNIIEWMRSIIHPGMGCALAFRVDPETYSIIVEIKPCAQADVPLLNGSLVPATIPNPFDGQGASPIPIDVHGDPTTFDAEIVESDDAEDYILVVGGPDSYGISLKIGDALIPDGWDWTEDPYINDNPNSFHLFKINEEWLGTQWEIEGEGIPATIISTETGINQVDREFGGNHPANSTLNFLRELLWPGASNQRYSPRLFIKKQSSPELWEYFDKKVSIIPMPFGRIKFGQTLSEAEDLKFYFNKGCEIILSIGISGWHPTLTAWRRTTPNPRDLPRVRRIDLPQCERETGLIGTAVRIEENIEENEDYMTRIVKIQTETTKEDDVPGICNALACAQAKSQTNSTTLTLRTKGSMTQRFDLGEAISTVEYGKSPNSTKITVKAIVTSMTFNFTADQYGISYEALRVLG